MIEAAQLCMGCMEDRGPTSVCPRCGYNDAAPITTPLYLKHRTVLREQYLVGRMLGHGGFGITYLGWDLTLARKIAIKEYLPSGVASRANGDAQVHAHSGQAEKDFDWGLERFLDEARTIAKFQNHAGIVAVLNFFRENGTAYLIMDYLDGITLDEYLRRKDGKIPYERALRILMPVMDALREVHSANIMHRDISPDNVYICRNGPVKVLDFGAARYALSQHSRNLSIILKEGYAPEEQYRTKGNQGPWTDVYAVAATFYRTITGKRPPSALDRLDIDELETPSSLGVEMPTDAEAALLKALSVRAADRFPTMAEFQTAIGWPGVPLRGAVEIGGATTGEVPMIPSMVVSSIPEPDAETVAYVATPVVTPMPSARSAAQSSVSTPAPAPAPASQKKGIPKWVFAVAGVVALVLISIGVFLKLNKPAQPPTAPTQEVAAVPPTASDAFPAPPPQAVPDSQPQSSPQQTQQPGGPASKRSTPAPAPVDVSKPAEQPKETAPAPKETPAPPSPAHTLQFKVAHDHGGGFETVCEGPLIISGDTVEFRGTAHSFRVKKADVMEAKMNKGLGRVIGKAFGRAGNNAFHIKIAQGNFNLVSLGEDRKSDAIIILNSLKEK